MADTKVKVLLSLTRFAIAAAVGIAIGWLWNDTMQGAAWFEWYYPYLAGFITFVFAAFMLNKLKAAGD